MERKQEDHGRYTKMKSQLFQLLEMHRSSIEANNILDMILERIPVNEIICSQRDIENIHTIEELIRALEMRNSVNPNDVSKLVQISGLIIVKSNKREWMTQVYSLVCDYDKNIKNKNCPFCQLKYGEDHQIEPQDFVNCKVLDSLPTTQNNTNSVCNSGAMSAEWWKRIACFCNWSFLRRLPGLTERDLNIIRKKYSNNSKESLREAFYYWVSTCEEHVIATLIMKAFMEMGHIDAITAVFS